MAAAAFLIAHFATLNRHSGICFECACECFLRLLQFSFGEMVFLLQKKPVIASVKVRCLRFSSVLLLPAGRSSYILRFERFIRKSCHMALFFSILMLSGISENNKKSNRLATLFLAFFNF